MTKTDKSVRSLIPAAKRALLGGGVSLLALTVASQAFAQQQPASYNDDTQEIVVSGFRKSLADALEVKRQASDFVEVISAEDIGKLPDESIADSIARLPGLAAQRNNSGRDQDISVRGLPPAMTTTLLNGREQTSTSNNRDVQFDQYPAELMSQVMVYKTGDASLVGAGISTIDLKTIRPLDYGKFALTMGAQGQYDTRGALQEGSGASAFGNRENITYVDQFAHNTVGVLLGYAHTDSPNQILSQHAWGFSGNSSVPGGGLQDWVQSDVLKRDAVAVTLQWKPNDKFEWTTDGFYSKYIDDKLTRGIEGPITATSGNSSTESFNWVPQIENYDYKEKDSLKSVGTNFKYKIADSWHTDIDLNYNSAFRKMPQIELSSGFNPNGTQNVIPVTVTASGGSNGGLIKGSGQSFSDPNLFALGENQPWQNFYPANWNNANGQFNQAGTAVWKQFTTKDTIKAARWDVAHDMDNNYLSEISAGVNYSDRKKSYLHEEGVAYLNSLNPAMQVPSSLLVSPTDLSAFGFGSVLSIDPVKAYDSGLYTFGTRYDNSKDNWFIEEKVTTAYVKADIETQMFGHEVTGNIGTQWVHTNQSTLQFAENCCWSSYTFVPTPGGIAYSEFLPSLNLTYHIDADQDAKFGLGRSMARARLDNIAGGYVVNYNTAVDPTKQSPWSATSGNAKLKPWISDDLDLDYTRSFDNGAYVSVAGYFKHLETFVYDGTQLISFAGQIPQGTGTILFNEGPSSSYQDGHGGSIYGSELSGNLPFEKIHPMLKGFGIEGNVAVNISNVNIPISATNTSPNGQIPELSKWTASATLYYQNEGFEARVNDRYRSKYVQEVPNYDGSLQNIEGTAENIVDIQLSYSWDTGNLKGLSTRFSVQNVTDTPQNSYYAGHPNQSDYYKLYGTSMLFGVSYKM